MLYICDFFTRNREAVSNQIELLAKNTNGSVLAATRFMGQRALRRRELRDRMFILPAWLYGAVLPVVALLGRQPMHYFEEEPSTLRRVLFNWSRRPLYVSMYRRPNEKYAAHLQRYRHVRKVFVEMDEHKDILMTHGVSPGLIAVSPTPAKITHKMSRNAFDPRRVTVVFASWNNEEKDALHQRGLLYLLDLLVQNPGFRLEIALRDNRITEFQHEAANRHVGNRVVLHDIGSTKELVALFDRADLVAFVAQARVTKDVPNSLLDGLMRGKPILISDVLDFHHTVQRHHLGIVIKQGAPARELSIKPEIYALWSQNAYTYATRHTPRNYLRILDHYL